MGWMQRRGTEGPDVPACPGRLSALVEGWFLLLHFPPSCTCPCVPESTAWYIFQRYVRMCIIGYSCNQHPAHTETPGLLESLRLKFRVKTKFISENFLRVSKLTQFYKNCILLSAAVTARRLGVPPSEGGRGAPGFASLALNL